MKLTTMLAMAGIATSVAFATPASAETVRYDYSCNSDGFIHVIAWQSSGYGYEFSTGQRCGPELKRIGPMILIIIVALKSEVSPDGQAFLTSLERGAPITAKRMPGQVAGSARAAAGKSTSIRLARGDLTPRLAALLASIDLDAKRGDQGSSKAFSIFDRWGKLITPMGEPILVPGDVGLTLPRANSETAEGGNAKARCLAKHGYWKDTGGEWGCWTTAK